MTEVFEGRRVDWNNFTAKDAIKCTEEAQKYLQEKEYIDIIKEIACATNLGQFEITLTKKLTDYTISKLKANGFKVFSDMQIWSMTTIASSNTKPIEHWETTIKW